MSEKTMKNHEKSEKQILYSHVYIKSFSTQLKQVFHKATVNFVYGACKLELWQKLFQHKEEEEMKMHFMNICNDIFPISVEQTIKDETCKKDTKFSTKVLKFYGVLKMV